MFIPNAITIETGGIFLFTLLLVSVSTQLTRVFHLSFNTTSPVEKSFIFRSFLNRDKCLSTIETYIAKFKAEEERQARKKEKVLQYAVKQSAKSTKESLDKFAETSRESFSQIAVAGRSVRSSIFAGISSVFRGPTEEGAEGGEEAKTTK